VQGSNQYILQLATVKYQPQAAKIREELGLLGFNAWIDEQKTGNSAVYRVCMGPFDTKNDALSTQEQLKKMNRQSMLVYLGNKPA
jgi:cell division protein FtsN